MRPNFTSLKSVNFKKITKFCFRFFLVLGQLRLSGRFQITDVAVMQICDLKTKSSKQLLLAVCGKLTLDLCPQRIEKTRAFKCIIDRLDKRRSNMLSVLC